MIESPPTNGTLPSRLAAESMRGCAATIRQRLYDLILKQGLRGATAAELEHVTGIPGNTIRPRLVELREEQRITTMGEMRLTSSGRKALAWIAVAVVP